MRLLLTLRRWLRMDLGDVGPNFTDFAGTKVRGKPHKNWDLNHVSLIKEKFIKGRIASGPWQFVRSQKKS